MKPLFVLGVSALLCAALGTDGLTQPATTEPAGVVVVADGIPQPLAPPGDAARGRALLIARDPANCILCHGLADAAVRFSGNLAPPLDGAGSRLTIAQLRLRVVDSSRLNPETIMPSYYKTAGLRAVATAYQGRPVLTAQQVEDVVVYLSTLR